MTTLPQTTAIRVPQRAPTRALAVGGPGHMMPMAQAEKHGLTSSDVWRIIRGHMWLILVLLIVSAVGGYFINWYLARHYSRYTATGLIKIQAPPGFSLISETKEARMDTSTLQVEQKSQARMLTHQSLLIRVLKDREDVRKTDWFKSFGNNIVKAKEDLLDKLDVNAVPDTRLVAISMSYSKPEDTKTIVEELVTQHL